MELKHFNDAWANQNDYETNDSQTMDFLTDLSFNFTSKKWENQIVKYDHKDLKFITTVVTAGIERHSDLECRDRNLNDIIGFRSFNNHENLMMIFLSSDENFACQDMSVSIHKPGAYVCAIKGYIKNQAYNTASQYISQKPQSY